MSSIKKVLTFFVFVCFGVASYGQVANSDSYIFRVWGRGTGGSFERALFRWDNSTTLLESRDNLRINFYNTDPPLQNPSDHFLFNKDFSFNIRKTLANNSSGQFTIRGGANNDRFWLGTLSNHMLSIGVNGQGCVNFLPGRCTIFYKNGNDLYDTNLSAANRARYALFVEGGILSEDFALGPKNSWADFVFEKDYRLAPLSEVETYITENKRLPQMPSADEVQQDGYCLHEMNVKLLQKIEELTLYVIKQEKKIEELEKWISTDNRSSER